MSRAALGWAAIAAALFITLLAASPWWPGQLVDAIPGKDKTGHVVLMGLLGAACVVAFAGRTWRGRRIGAGMVLGVVAIAVTVDEIIQAFVPTRTFDLGDLAASLAGIAVIGGLAALLTRRTSDP